MSLFFIGLLLVASFYDIKTMRVPNLLSFTLMLLPLISYVFYSKVNINFDMNAILATLLLTVPGYLKGGFGAADIKILLGISCILSLLDMLIFLSVCFIVFIIYSPLFFNKRQEAPFVPSLFFTYGVYGFITL